MSHVRHERPTVVAALAALATAALLAGCATPIARSVVQANLAQEQAANRLLLLNIARAHERMPMHFSQIGQIRSAPGGWGLGVPSLSLELPFGGAATPEYKLTAGNEGASPADVTALTSQEFMRGITTPVTADTLAYFLNQGWTPQMLLHLFLESVAVTNRHGQFVQLRNDPGEDGHAAFSDFVDATAECDIDVDSKEGEKDFLSTPVTTVGVRDGVAAAKAELRIVPVAAPAGAAPVVAALQHYRLAQVPSTAVLQFKLRAGGKGSWLCALPPQPNADGSTPSPTATSAGTQSQTASAGRRLSLTNNKPAVPSRPMPQAGRAAAPATVQAAPLGEESFVLRSPQSMLYYLGQLSRAQNGKRGGLAEPLKITSDGSKAVLFDMRRNADAGQALVEVDYAGKRFSVHGDGPEEKDKDRSSTVLSLMLLILGLQDKGTESPGTSSVRLVR